MNRMIQQALRATTAMGFCLATPLFAQEPPRPASPPTPPPVSLDDAADIIVTARRSDERLQDVPISITVFSQQQLTNRNIITASDLGRYTPSLSVNSRYGPDKSSFAIRGFTQEGPTSPSVAVYFADVVAPRANGSTTGGNGAGPGSFFDLQNVQVLKGPQGTLFGRNTTGGAILLVPQKPTSRLEGYVEASFGNYEMRRIQAVLNVPLSEGIRLRLGVDRQTRDGFLVNRSGIGPADFADVDYTALRASLVVDVTPNLESYTIGTYSHSHTNGSMGRLLSCQRDPLLRIRTQIYAAQGGCDQIDRQNARGDSLYDVENSRPNPFTRLRQWQVINTTTWQPSDTLTVRNIVSYAQYREAFAANLNGDNAFVPSSLVVNQGGSLVTVPTGAAAGLPYAFVSFGPQPGLENVKQSTFTEELQLRGKLFDNRLDWQIGGYVEISEPLAFGGTTSAVNLSCTDPLAKRCTDIFQPLAGARVGVLQIVQSRMSFRNLGLYAQGSYHLTDQLSLTGGLRYTADRTRGTGRNLTASFPTPENAVTTCGDTVHFPGKVTNNPNDCAYTATEKSTAPTWLVDLDYKPVEDMLLYAKYSRGYRQGNVNTSTPGIETFGPEKVEAYEIGAKTSFRGAISGTLNVAAFYNDLTNQQIQATAIPKPGTGVPGAQVIVNAGKSRIKGVEVDASIRLLRGLTIDAAYAYLDTRLISIALPTLAAASPYGSLSSTVATGGRLTLAPLNRVTLTGSYTLPLNESIGAITLGATFTHTDRQLVSQNTNGASVEPTNLLNLNLNWNQVAGSALDLALFATNVTKQRYINFINGSFSSTGYEGGNVGEPRMYGVRLRYRFGT